MLRGLLGIEPNTTSHAEKLVSVLGGFLGILCILWISRHYLDLRDAALIVASMGASAVLLFAVPHGPLSQPWHLVGGHLISALIGVTCARYVEPALFAAALAVGIAIGAMYYLQCIHPPGGATALTAVVGGSAVQDLGYHFVLTPVLLNVAVILVTAIAVNALFPWRRYPAAWHRKRATPHPATGESGEAEEEDVLSAADLEYALKQLDLYVDVTEQELAEIFTLATEHARQTHLPVEDIRLGAFYSNGRYGTQWSVRQVVDESSDPQRDMIIYKVVAGADRRSTGSLSRAEFARWAKYEVQRDEYYWKRVRPDRH
jgi:CBS-domain-containing membrane protein